MTATDIILAVLVGVFLVLITPSITRQQNRLWGRRQEARLEKAQHLASDPAQLTVWCLKEGLIVALTALMGLLLLITPAAIAAIDVARGVPLEGFGLVLLALMVLTGLPLVYLALRAGSQVLHVLEGLDETDSVRDEGAPEA